MKDDLADRDTSLPLSLARRLDEACYLFECMCKAGQQPQIEEYLQGKEEPERSALLHELVLLELHYRRLRGETPQLDEYLRRFPEISSSLRRHFEGNHVILPDRAFEPTPSQLAHSPLSEAGLTRVPTLPGYTILGLLGRGGMGLVYRARQVKLNRIVALKMILAGDFAGPQELARFRSEAEAVARLQHPNIVHIYEIGEHEGRPYFSMEFVDGSSLAQKLAGAPQPAWETAQLVETLARAIHHAHQRGVIHRDLKPANVLLTTEGVPKITDFGLAKQLNSPVDGLTTPRHQTQSGDILGTPSYMAPEQAAGRAQQIGPATDTYSLGAILYEMLTGRPPHRGTTVLETLEQVRSQDPVPPTRLQSKIPRDLETVCLKCLQKEPHLRYGNAEALALDLRRFLNGETIAARPRGVVGQGIKWAKRRPALAALVVISSLGSFLLLATLLASNMLIRQEKTRALENYHTAEKQRERAEAHLQLAREAIGEYTRKIAQDPRLRAHDLEDLRQQLLGGAVIFYQKLVEQSDSHPKIQAERGRTFRELAELTQALAANKSEAGSLLQQARELLERLVQAYPTELEYQAELARVHNTEGIYLKRVAGRPLQAEGAFQKALVLWELLVRDGPDVPAYQNGLALVRLNLAELYRLLGRKEEAETFYQECLDVFEQLVRDHAAVLEYQETLGEAYNDLGVFHGSGGRLEQAETAFEKSVAVREQLARAHPTISAYQTALATSHNNLGNIYRFTNREDRAEEAYQRALTLREQLVRAHPSITTYQYDLAASYYSLGIMYRLSNRFDKAAEAYVQARALLERLATAHPSVLEYRSLLGKSTSELGDLSYNTGQMDRAKEFYNQALTIKQSLVREHPEVAGHVADWGESCARMGRVLRRTGEVEAALDWYRQAIDALKQVVRREPQHVPGRSFLRGTHRERAEVFSAEQRYADALADWDAAIELEDKDANRAVLQAHRLRALAHVQDPKRTAAEAVRSAQQAQPPVAALYPLACTYGACATAVLADPQRTATERDQIAKQYTTSALGLLKRAQAAGFFDTPENRDELEKDADLTPLRSYEEFKKLLNELKPNMDAEGK